MGPGYEWVRRGGSGEEEFVQGARVRGRGQRAETGTPGGGYTLLLGESVSVAGWHWDPVAVGTEGTAG